MAWNNWHEVDPERNRRERNEQMMRNLGTVFLGLALAFGFAFSFAELANAPTAAPNYQSK